MKQMTFLVASCVLHMHAWEWIRTCSMGTVLMVEMKAMVCNLDIRYDVDAC